jgi:hypothetical protein
MEEVWRPVQDYPDYQVSNLGRVKSLKFQYGIQNVRILSQRPNTSGYLQTDLSRVWKSAPIHLLVATTFVENPDPINKTIVDHKNGDIKDNRSINLRWTTPHESAMNCGIRKNNTSGFKGVCFRKDISKWSSAITAYGKRIHLGLFQTPEEASAVYNAKAKEIHGEFYRPLGV